MRISTIRKLAAFDKSTTQRRSPTEAQLAELERMAGGDVRKLAAIKALREMNGLGARVQA